MRCYHLANTYLPGIHAGIQSAHVQHEMATKYLLAPITTDQQMAQQEVYVEWATNHKTMIVLNGGWQSSLQEWAKFFQREDNMLPWATFHEELESLNGAMTNVGIIVPEYIYGASRAIRSITQPGVGQYADKPLPDGRIVQFWMGEDLVLTDANDNILHTYIPFEVELATRLSYPNLMA